MRRKEPVLELQQYSVTPGEILAASTGVALVAQVSNLLCRGFPIGQRHHVARASDWKSGIQQVGNLRYRGSSVLVVS